MTVDLNIIQKTCRAMQKGVALAYPGLRLHFIYHKRGKLKESLALAEHDIITHPAGQAAMAIIRKHTKTESSSFVGLAIANEKKMMGLKNIDRLIALLNVNTDEFKTEEEALTQIYHMTWHAIDLYEIRQQPAYKGKFKSGPMVPKRSPLNIAKAHLQADAFAATLASLKDKTDLMKMITKKRGIQALSPLQNFKAEDFPFVIALDACRFAIKELALFDKQPDEFIATARRVSVEVGHTFDSTNIQQWWDFSIPAQDMAWRGFNQEQILGAAVNVCEDPFVRSIGYMIEEVSSIEPASSESLEHSYNAFMDPEVNMKLHREMIDSVFEDVIAQGVTEKSSRPFLNLANEQNEELTEGRFLGWCAAALQGAAKAFESAIQSGASPDQAARMHLQGSRGEGGTDKESWDTLLDLGNKIVDQRRQGAAVTMGHIAEICHNNPNFAPVLDSLKITMNDPAYIQKLEASNDLAFVPNAPSIEGPTPKGPEIKGPELGPKAPIPNMPTPTPMPTFAPSAPGMGGNAGANNRMAQIMRQRHLEAQKQAAEQSNSQSNSQGDKTE